MNAVLGGFRDLLSSERGAFAIALAAFSWAMVFYDRMTIDQWMDFNQWLSGMLIGSKTLTTGIELVTTKRVQTPPGTEPPPTPPPSPTADRW